MAGGIVIDNPSPLNTAMAAVAGYMQQQRQNKTDAQNAAMAARAMQLQERQGRASISADQARTAHDVAETHTLERADADAQLLHNLAPASTPKPKSTDPQTLANWAYANAEHYANASDMTRADLWRKQGDSYGATFQHIESGTLSGARAHDITYERPREFNNTLAFKQRALEKTLGSRERMQRAAIEAKLQSTAATVAGHLQAAGIASASRENVAQLNASVRRDLATLTQYNLMNRMSFQDAARMAETEYVQGMSNYRQEVGADDAATAGGRDEPFANATPPAAPSMTTINLPAPSVITVPNPYGGQPIPVVQPGTNTPPPGVRPPSHHAQAKIPVQQQRALHIRAVVGQQRQAGRSDAEIATMARQAGISDSELHAAGVNVGRPAQQLVPAPQVGVGGG